MKTPIFLKSGLVLVALMLGAVTGANAGIIQVVDGYQVSYSINMKSTPTGNSIQNVAIFEWNEAGDRNVDYPYSIAGSGKTKLSHTIDFAPTSAFIIGYLDAVAGIDDEKRHLYTIVDIAYSNFIVENLLGVKFSTIYGQGEQFTINKLLAATSGDDGAMNELWNFVIGPAANGAFDPNGGFRVHKWSGAGPPSDVPVPATVALFGVGLAGLGWSRRKKA
jgi:hypothetical protein